MSSFIVWLRELAAILDRRNERMVQSLAGRDNFVVVRFDDPYPWPPVWIGVDPARPGADVSAFYCPKHGARTSPCVCCIIDEGGGENYQQRITRERKDR